MSKRHIISQKGSEPPDKICKVEMQKAPSASEKGSDPPDETIKVEIQKIPKFCCYCRDPVTEFCHGCPGAGQNVRCRKGQCSKCTREFHFHCHQMSMNKLNLYYNANPNNCINCQHLT